jgi:DNA processing protein
MVDSTIERAALLALLRDNARPWSAIVDEVEAVGSALAVLRDGLTVGQGNLLDPDPTAHVDELLGDAARASEAWSAGGLRLTTMVDEDYPAQLREVHQQPPFLFYRGTLSADDANGVAVVGTRKPTGVGVKQAIEIARGLAEQGVTVISGLAAGIDRAAHEGALSADGRTVAVIGTGIRQSYPRDNADLQERLAREHLVISQFWPDAPPTKSSFPMRNAVMSGYAAATVVVEAAWRSGARMQARLALEHNRPVFLLDSLLRHDWAREYAARPGTTVVSGADEVLRALASILQPSGDLALA